MDTPVVDEKALEAATQANSGGDAVLTFAKAILHGDQTHRDWLIEAAHAFIAGGTLPAPKSGTKPADLVAMAAQKFCEELQEDADGVPQLQLKELHDALDEWEKSRG